jgi:hypothetical protein
VITSKNAKNYEEWDRNLQSNFLLLLFYAISVVHSDKKEIRWAAIIFSDIIIFVVLFDKKKLSANKVRNAIT